MRRRTLESGNKIKWDANGRAIIDGYEAVDLGLNFVIATRYIGASNEESMGSTYRWGETPSYSSYYSSGSGESFTLPLNRDTARQVMGGRWRMPTIAEIKKIWNECNGSWTNYGVTWTSKKNPNAYVRFKAPYNDGANIWTSSGSNYSSTLASRYCFSSTSFVQHLHAQRYNYYYIRGVISKSELGL